VVILISTVHLLRLTFLTKGPFWISSTTIIILYFSSTLAGYLAALHTDTKYYYDFTLLTAAAGLMYGYVGFIPTILWGAMKWYGCEPSLLEILCLYGYGGMIVWIPVVCTPTIFAESSHYWLR
jgi:protein YIPF1/2